MAAKPTPRRGDLVVANWADISRKSNYSRDEVSTDKCVTVGWVVKWDDDGETVLCYSEYTDQTCGDYLALPHGCISAWHVVEQP